MDGQVGNVEYAPRYSVDEEVVMFLSQRANGEYTPVGLSLGKYTVKQNPADGAPMVVRFTVPLDRAYDARFIPNPPAAERVPLEAFKASIVSRAAEGWDGRPIPGISAEALRAISPTMNVGGVK